jgi:hypothetical protein
MTYGQAIPRKIREIIGSDLNAAVIFVERYGREFPDGEAVISADPRAAAFYAQHILHRRWRLGEPFIALSATHASDYARNVVKGRWMIAEPVIATDSRAATDYAQHFMTASGDRFLEAEPVICKHPVDAVRYAINVLKQRWLDAEPAIYVDRRARHTYADAFGVKFHFESSTNDLYVMPRDLSTKLNHHHTEYQHYSDSADDSYLALYELGSALPTIVRHPMKFTTST